MRDEWAAYVQAVVDDAPPVTDEKRREIAELLKGGDR